MIKNRLAALRARHGKGITRAHLARQIHVSRSYVTKLEQGRLRPSAEVMFRISKYFGRPVEDVFQYLDESEAE